MSELAETDDIKTKALELISDYMGKETARMYTKFYDVHSDHDVLNSINQLLEEYLGSQKAREVLTKKGLIL